MLNFIYFIFAFFATLALIAISLELKNTRDVIEDLASSLDELNVNIQELNEPKN